MKLPGVKESVMIRKESDDDVYAMNVDAGDMIRLNKTALAIVECCQDGLCLDDAYKRMSEGVSEGLDKIKPDIEKTIKKLQELGFLEA